MTRFRRLLLTGLCVGALLVATSRPASALIQVIDSAALEEWVSQIKLEVENYALQVKQFATQNLQWLKQVQQYAMQGQQYLQEIELYNNFFHNPTLANAMGMLGRTGIGMGNSLPLNSYALMGLVNGLTHANNGAGFGQLTGLLANLSSLSSQAWTTSHIYSPTDGSWASSQVMARADGIAGAQGAAQAAYTDLRTHSDVLQPLRTDLLGATDTKTVLDASAQAQLETAWNVNQLAQLTAVQNAYVVQQDSVKQRDEEKLDKDIEDALATSPVRDIVPAGIPTQVITP